VIFGDVDFVIGDQTGISGPEEDEALLRAISLYLGSSVGRYLIFFHSLSWGIDRTTLRPTDLRDVVVPFFSKKEEQELASLHRSVVEREKILFEKTYSEKKGLFSDVETPEILFTQEDLQREIDEKIEEIMGLPKSVSIYIHDFINISLSLNKGKTNSSDNNKIKAIEPPSSKELEAYALRLRGQLDSYTADEGIKHLVSVVYSRDLTICQVAPVKTVEYLDVFVTEAKENWKTLFEQINKSLQDQFSQWFYFQRELRIFDSKREVVSICKPSRLIHWMESKAISDANDIIAESLAGNGYMEVPSRNVYDSQYSNTSKVN
jgi:hypothetical protein